jgi:Tfp pilus assembly protein FimT
MRQAEAWFPMRHVGRLKFGGQGLVMTRNQDEHGVGLIEIIVVVAIIMVFVAISVPAVRSTLRSYHLNSAVTAVTGAIQSARYRTIMYGCSHNIAFLQTTTTYQVANQALAGAPPVCAAAFTNVGGLVSWSGTGDVTMTPSTTLQFRPNGTVFATTGTLQFTMTNGTIIKTITVSGVGNINVTP